MPATTAKAYAVEFYDPDGGKWYAGMHKDAFGFAPTLATALIYDDPDTAKRVLDNAYGNFGKQYGSVVRVAATTREP